MSTGSETAAPSPLDWLKWLMVAAVVGGGIFGNWYFQEEPLLYRAIALVALAAVAALLVVQTRKGGAAWEMMKEARGEIRRVVWPKREETVQTTVIVLVLVLIFALILWLLDTGLSWIVKSLIG